MKIAKNGVTFLTMLKFDLSYKQFDPRLDLSLDSVHLRKYM